MFFSSKVNFNISVLVPEEFLQQNDMLHLNESVSRVTRRCALVENLQTFRENAVPKKGSKATCPKTQSHIPYDFHLQQHYFVNPNTGL